MALATARLSKPSRVSVAAFSAASTRVSKPSICSSAIRARRSRLASRSPFSMPRTCSAMSAVAIAAKGSANVRLRPAAELMMVTLSAGSAASDRS